MLKICSGWLHLFTWLVSALFELIEPLWILQKSWSLPHGRRDKHTTLFLEKPGPATPGTPRISVVLVQICLHFIFLPYSMLWICWIPEEICISSRDSRELVSLLFVIILLQRYKLEIWNMEMWFLFLTQFNMNTNHKIVQKKNFFTPSLFFI